MADMPQMIAAFNAMGGGAAAAIAAVEMLRDAPPLSAALTLGVVGALIGSVSFSGSLVAFAKLQGLMKRSPRFGGRQPLNLALRAAAAAIMLAYARKAVIVPGYGVAVAQAQHKVWELAQLLIGRGVELKFAIHPVAGRMPGHMNVLLAEAGVPYDLIRDLDEINPEFPTADVAIVIGANDVVNPAARSDAASPIYGMPILDVDRAKNVLVVKRGRGTGFAGIENDLFHADNANMLFGDAQDVVARLIQGVKQV